MESRIENLNSKKLIGMHMDMTLGENKTAILWQTFMPRRLEVLNRRSTDYVSMQVYQKDQKDLFSPVTPFVKWAAVEVDSHDHIPEGMHRYVLMGGTYAVFVHKGPASDFPKTMQFIFGDWLPESEYELDNREHFEILPEGYNPLSPDAREDVWIPVILK